LLIVERELKLLSFVDVKQHLLHLLNLLLMVVFVIHLHHLLHLKVQYSYDLHHLHLLLKELLGLKPEAVVVMVVLPYLHKNLNSYYN
jgi:hypothetical protein